MLWKPKLYEFSKYGSAIKFSHQSIWASKYIMLVFTSQSVLVEKENFIEYQEKQIIGTTVLLPTKQGYVAVSRNQIMWNKGE